MVKQIVAWTAVAFTAFAVTTSAMALTIPSGSVISDGVVTPAHETDYGKKQLEDNGYLVVGNTVIIAIGTETVSIAVSDVVGATEESLTETISEAIDEQIDIESMDEIQAQDFAASLEEIGGFDGSDLTIDEIVDQINDGGVLTNVSEDVADKVLVELQNDIEGQCAESGAQAVEDADGNVHSCS